MCVYELCGGFFITMNIFVNHGRVHVCIVVVFSSQLKQSFLVKYLNYFLRSDEISGLFHNLLHNTRIVKFETLKRRIILTVWFVRFLFKKRESAYFPPFTAWTTTQIAVSLTCMRFLLFRNQLVQFHVAIDMLIFKNSLIWFHCWGILSNKCS